MSTSAEGGIGFMGMPPTGGTEGPFPFQGEPPARPIGDGQTDVDVAAISGERPPSERITDTYTDIPGDGVVPG